MAARVSRHIHSGRDLRQEQIAQGVLGAHRLLRAALRPMRPSQFVAIGRIGDAWGLRGGLQYASQRNRTSRFLSRLRIGSCCVSIDYKLWNPWILNLGRRFLEIIAWFLVISHASFASNKDDSIYMILRDYEVLIKETLDEVPQCLKPTPVSCCLVQCEKIAECDGFTSQVNGKCALWDYAFVDIVPSRRPSTAKTYTRVCEEHFTSPDVPAASMEFTQWKGKYPAPIGASVTFTCPYGKIFNDGASTHQAKCTGKETWEYDYDTVPSCIATLKYTENILLIYTGYMKIRAICPDQENAVLMQDGGQCLGDSYPQCRLTEKGKDYIGVIAWTEKKQKCERWDTMPHGIPDDFLIPGKDPDYNWIFPQKKPSKFENFCRNPTSRDRPWCFIDDPVEKWQYCNIPLCKDTSIPECKMTRGGREYMGKRSQTASGKACRYWKKSLSSNPERSILFPDGLIEDHNFCRSPDDDPGGPWCFVDPEPTQTDWETCDIPLCPGANGDDPGDWDSSWLSEGGGGEYGYDDGGEGDYGNGGEGGGGREETFLCDLEPSSIPGFYTFDSYAIKQNRGRPHGGITIAARPELEPELMAMSPQHVAISTTIGEVFCFYFPPSWESSDIGQEIATALSAGKADPTLRIVTGDFNCRVDPSAPTTKGRDLLDLMHSFGLEMVNYPEDPTYIAPNGSSCIDLVFTNAMISKHITEHKIHKSANRKHQCVTTTWRLKRRKRIQRVENPPRLKRKVDIDALLSHPDYPQIKAFSTMHNDKKLEILTRIIVDSTPKIKANKQIYKKWFDKECREKKKEAMRALHLALFGHTPLADYNQVRREYKALLKKAKAQHEDTQLLRKIEQSYITPWAILSRRQSSTPAPITQEQWVDHLTHTLNPPTDAPQIHAPGNLFENLDPRACKNPREEPTKFTGARSEKKQEEGIFQYLRPRNIRNKTRKGEETETKDMHHEGDDIEETEHSNR
ncbi:unnamed protein product [Darwinula stevensoni]|uniref:Kringle domain-containing protein n=1 Tax=Darwinula stevensoni TaxID=69355 RepID=A0A7R9A5X9_9CRUS|nr:unnamed protein product [Darwinula stevensoni]CAG0886293.1 unnamed protein product [Darwinula stevensoni]